jgi:DNA invertase Pin-like site-specific DNA recombinase
MAKVYGYMRVSHDDSAQSGLGLKAQRQQILNWYRMLRSQPKHRGNMEWGKLVIDKAVSAYSKKFITRPAGRWLHEQLQTGDHIIFARLDRGFRNLRDCLAMMEVWRDKGVIVHFCDIQVDSGTAIGKLVINIMGTISEWYSATISERTKEALAQRKLARQRVCSFAPIGYKLGQKNPRGRQYLIQDKQDQALCRLTWIYRHLMKFTWPFLLDRIEAILAKRQKRKPLYRIHRRQWGKMRGVRGMLRWEEFRDRRKIDPDAVWPSTVNQKDMPAAPAKMRAVR